MRSKVNTCKEAIINNSGGKSYDELINKVLRSKIPYKAVQERFYLNTMQLYFVVAKNPDPDSKEPFILLITNLDQNASKIARHYLIRWKIEHCFFHLKSNGFKLESINLQSKSRRKLLMAIAVFAYLLSIHQGLKTYKSVPSKKYANGEEWKAKSVFKHGFEQLIGHCKSIITFCHYIDRQIRQSLNSHQSPFSLNVQ